MQKEAKSKITSGKPEKGGFMGIKIGSASHFDGWILLWLETTILLGETKGTYN